jgi:hypothetical protein
MALLAGWATGFERFEGDELCPWSIREQPRRTATCELEKVRLGVKSTSLPASFNEVIDRTVEEYLDAVGAARFDLCHIELRILATPEFRRVHDIQVQYLEDIDIETPVIDYMRKRVYSDLNEHVGPDGTKDLIEVLAGRAEGNRFTWYRLDGITTPQLLTFLKALIEDEAQRPVQGNVARIARLASLIQERQEGEA